MSKKASRISYWLLAIGLMAVVAVLVSIQRSATANGHQPLNVSIDDETVRKYKEMATLSLDERKNIFRAASANGKSALWQLHFAEYRKAHPELTLAQIKVLEEAAALANPLTFSLPDNQTIKNAAVGKALQNLKEHALAVFPPDEAKNIFAQLGTVKASSSLMAKKACEPTQKQSRRALASFLMQWRRKISTRSQTPQPESRKFLKTSRVAQLWSSLSRTRRITLHRLPNHTTSSFPKFLLRHRNRRQTLTAANQILR